MKKIEEQSKISDTDIQLYLAGLLPKMSSLYMGWLILINKDLKTRMKAIENENRQYHYHEGTSLHKKLFPFVKPENERFEGGSETEKNFWGLLGLKWGGAVTAVLIAMVLTIIVEPEKQVSEEALFTAKGYSLGMNLYVNGSKRLIVENYQQVISNEDTLQLFSVGEHQQYLILYGWEPSKGYSRLFPHEGKRAGPVSKTKYPPSLQLEGGVENKLICISSTQPFDFKKAGEILEMEPFSNLKEAPSSLLLDDIYVQIFTLTNEAL